jgi:hypothetical protein
MYKKKWKTNRQKKLSQNFAADNKKSKDDNSGQHNNFLFSLSKKESKKNKNKWKQPSC